MYKLLSENANDDIILYGITPEGLPCRFLQINGVTCRMLGYSKEDQLQPTLEQTQAVEEAEFLPEKDQEALNVGSITH